MNGNNLQPKIASRKHELDSTSAVSCLHPHANTDKDEDIIRLPSDLLLVVRVPIQPHAPASKTGEAQQYKQSLTEEEDALETWSSFIGGGSLHWGTSLDDRRQLPIKQYSRGLDNNQR